MNWKNKKVLVTGAEGFIGSHLVEKLLALGADVTCLVKYNFNNNWGFIEDFDKFTKEKAKIVSSDITDFEAMLHLTKNIDTIFHLAALISIPYSYSNPGHVINTNVMGTYNVLAASRENNVKKVIHTSTSEVYGTAEYTPIDEKHPLHAQSPYSASKIAADKIAESFYSSFDLSVTILRPFNTYGPRQSARAVIPTIIYQALTKNNIKLGSLTPVRDFTYVADVVEGFIKTAESSKAIGNVINIGFGAGISVGELAKNIIGLLNKKLTIVTDKARIRPAKSEVMELIADNKKAKKLLNWEPKISFEQGLKKTIDWMSKNLDYYKKDMYYT